MADEYLHFVTGRLAEKALRDVLGQLESETDWHYSVQVLPITVAALMTPSWIARHLQCPPQATKIVVPGYCQGDLDVIQQSAQLPVELGPRDLRDLPDHFGHAMDQDPWGKSDIQIVAEIIE